MMRRVVTLAVYCFLAYTAFLMPRSSVFAAGEFQADYHVTYAISPIGKTIVTQEVTLTNKLPNFYPQQYSLILDSDKIKNVIAYDDGGVISPKVSIIDGKTHISLEFNVKAIGLGKSLTFSLRYEHAGIATKNGTIWEIYVPGVSEDPDIERYDVTLTVPSVFGPASYLSPKPAKGNTWTKDQMTKGGITGAYGTAQQFRVSLDYELSNPSVLTSIQDIALPPDTAYQKVSIISLEPKPVTVQSDADGNWIARYQIPPKQQVSVKAVANIAVHLSARKDALPQAIDESVYTMPQEYWEVHDNKIQELSKTYTTPYAIYEYVSNHLSYDYEKVNIGALRMGAKEILANPDTAVCTEFTDLFVAISRAAGIPARRIVGYAYTNNAKLRPLSLVSDVLHAWPEYYDSQKNLWVPIDPTWAHTTGGVDYFTKLDYNHIVFAINGTHSTEPYPAGFYHDPGKQAKDVSVEFLTTTDSNPSQIHASIEFPDQVRSGTKTDGSLIVTNTGGESAYRIETSLSSTLGSIDVSHTIDELLPFAVVRIPFSGEFPSSFSSAHGSITGTVNGTTIVKSFVVRPMYWLIIFGSVFSILFIFMLWKLIRTHIWKRSKKH